jgi:hypothetical protein
MPLRRRIREREGQKSSAGPLYLGEVHNSNIHLGVPNSTHIDIMVD